MQRDIQLGFKEATQSRQWLCNVHVLDDNRLTLSLKFIIIL